MQPRVIALLVTLLPIVSACLAYAISAAQERVPLCIPPIHGCTSISRAARSSDALFLFRAAIIANGVLLIWYWRLTQLWLIALFKPSLNRYTMILVLGVSGALFLMLYADFLGSRGDFYRFMRRYGIIFYFTFTPLAQMLLLRNIFQLLHADNLTFSQFFTHTTSNSGGTNTDAKRNAVESVSRGRQNFVVVARLQLIVCGICLTIGLVSLFLDYFDLDTDAIDNIIEWNFALIMHLYFLGSFFLWHFSNYTLHPAIGPNTD